QKGYKKIINGLRIAKNLRFHAQEGVTVDQEQVDFVKDNLDNAFRALSDDFNTAQAIGFLFNLLKKINSVYTGQLQAALFGKEIFDTLLKSYISMVGYILWSKE